jgi:hypothetical protein
MQRIPSLALRAGLQSEVASDTFLTAAKLLYSLELEEWTSAAHNETSETGADSMTNRYLDGRVVFCMAEFIQRVTLAGFICCGIVIAGCGGSSETPTTTDSSGGAGSSNAASMDSGMSDPAMMNSGMGDPAMAGSGMGDPAMAGSGTSDPAMQASMTTSMEQSMASQAGTGFGDTSLGHAESSTGNPGGDLATTSAQMATLMTAPDAATNPSSPSGIDDATRAAAMATASAPGNASSDPSSDPAAISAEMAAAGGANGGPGLGSSGASVPGQIGPGDPGQSGAGGQAQEPPADSPDYPAFKVVMGLMQGKHEGLKDFMSATGRGLIEKIRGGSLTTAEIDDLKKSFTQPQLVGAPRTIRGSRTVTLSSGGEVITLVSKKQGSDWKVSSITIRAARKR